MSRSEVRVEINGKTYLGRIEVSGETVTVHTAQASKSTQIGASPVASIARILLREIVQGKKQRKDAML